jgi:hypothetical protein
MHKRSHTRSPIAPTGNFPFMRELPVSGVSITEYAASRRISKWKAGLHRDSPAFPQPIGFGGGARRIRYYNGKALDDYFAAVEGLEPRKADGSVKPTRVWGLWSSRPRSFGLEED